MCQKFDFVLFKADFKYASFRAAFYLSLTSTNRVILTCLPSLSGTLWAYQTPEEALIQNLLSLHRCTSKLQNLFQPFPSVPCTHKPGNSQLKKITNNLKDASNLKTYKERHIRWPFIFKFKMKHNL